VHCAKPFESAHKRRIYCSHSCSTLAYYARKAQASPTGATTPAQGPLSGPVPPGGGASTPAAQTLDWNLQNLAVLGTASALGQLGVSLGKKVVQAFSEPAASPIPVAAARVLDPLDWLPTGLLTSDAPRVPLELPSLGQTFVFVQLRYLGHTLFYQPRRRALLWRVVPGQLLALLSPEHVAFVAEQTPYQEPSQLPPGPSGRGLPKYLG